MDLSHPHDLLVRSVLGDADLAADLFRHYLPAEWVSRLDLDSLRREPTEAIRSDLSESIGDLRYLANFKDGEGKLKVFVYFEHQSRPDRFMSFRLLEQVCASLRDFLSAAENRKNATFPYPLAVVLHHGRTPWKKLLSMGELMDAKPGMSRDILHFPICLIDLALIPGDQLRGHPMVCALLDSLQAAATGRLSERGKGIFGRLRDIRDDSRLKSWSVSLGTYYVAVQRRLLKKVDDIADLLKIIYNAREAYEMTGSIVDEWLEEGITKGIAKGKAEGRAEGKMEAISFILESRFGGIPSNLKMKLEAMDDLNRIDEAMKLAMNCDDLKAFQKGLTGRTRKKR